VTIVHESSLGLRSAGKIVFYFHCHITNLKCYVVTTSTNYATLCMLKFRTIISNILMIHTLQIIGFVSFIAVELNSSLTSEMEVPLSMC
jgi:hypothetical protein